MCIRDRDGIAQKHAFEKEFQKWADANPGTRARYGQLLPAFAKVYTGLVPLNNAYTYLTEGMLGIEVMRFAYGFNNLVKMCGDKTKTDAEIGDLIKQLKNSSAAFYKNYNVAVDKQLFTAMASTYTRSCDPDLQATVVKQTALKYKGNCKAWAEDFYKKTIFADSVKVYSFLEGFTRGNSKKIEKDPAFVLATGIYTFAQNKFTPGLSAYMAEIDSLQRLYICLLYTSRCV